MVDEMESQMPVLQRPQQPEHVLGNAAFTPLASPTRGGASGAVWQLSLRPGPAAPHQLTKPEVFVALSGEARATIGGEQTAIRQGNVLVVPAGVDFALEALGEHAFEAIVCLPEGGQAVLPGGEPFTPPWAM